MTDSCKVIVHNGIDRAIEAALPALQSKLQTCPQEVQTQAAQSAEGLRACMKEQAVASGPTLAFQEDLIRLVFGHANPQLVEALRDFLETVNIYLVEMRERILTRKDRLDA